MIFTISTLDSLQSRTIFYLKMSHLPLPNKKFSIAKMAMAERKVDIFDFHNIDFGNQKQKIVEKIVFTIATYPV